jgi:hypothetical protein
MSQHTRGCKSRLSAKKATEKQRAGRAVLRERRKFKVHAGRTNVTAQFLTPARLKSWQQQHDLTLSDLARELDCDKGHLSRIVNGRVPITPKFARRFQEHLEQQHNEARRNHAILSRYRLPRRVLILAKARRCPGCGLSVILPYAQQRYCDDECRRKVRRARCVRRLR